MDYTVSKQKGERTMVYFDKPGKQNTERTLQLAVQAAKEEGIGALVVATGSGYTPLLLKGAAKELDIVVVTHANGYREPGEQELPAQVRRELQDCGMATGSYLADTADRILADRAGKASEAQAGKVSEAQAGKASEAQAGKASEAQAGKVSEVPAGKVSEVQAGMVLEVLVESVPASGRG